MTNPEAREAGMREHASQLARELSDVTLRSCVASPEKYGMRATKEKMRGLIDALTALRGRTVEQRLGNDGVVRFRAGDSSKSYMEDARYHSFMAAEVTG